MKIKVYVQENGKWIMKNKTINRFQHYWYSFQLIIPYYWNKLKQFFSGE